MDRKEKLFMDSDKQDKEKQPVQVTLQTHDIDLVALFSELLLQDLQAEVDKYGSYGKWLLATKNRKIIPTKRVEDVSND